MTKNEKKYFSISEVSKILDIKEYVIRHWDSIDPKTNKFRIEGLSIRTNGGTRFFNKVHIKKLSNLKNLLNDGGKRNYSLDLASQIISQNKYYKNINTNPIKQINHDDSRNFNHKIDKIKKINDKLKDLIK